LSCYELRTRRVALRLCFVRLTLALLFVIKLVAASCGLAWVTDLPTRGVPAVELVCRICFGSLWYFTSKVLIEYPVAFLNQDNS
jgi:hypothetical protein